jgi:uncharacterized protein YgbK (DUF1537 family)
VLRVPELLVVADDLSGALDTGAVFAARGFSTVVVPHRSGWRTPAECLARTRGCRVLVVDTATRHATPRTAAARVHGIVLEARRRGTRQFYKKTDSTLRGNLGSELTAFMRAAGVDSLPFAPAFPRVGRTTRHGRQLVDGVPLGSTAFARDALNPVRTGSIAAILSAQSAIVTTIIPRLAPGKPTRETEGPPQSDSTIRVSIFDAEDDGDLLRIAKRLRSTGALGVTAGSGGFAAALAQTLAGSRSMTSLMRPDPGATSGPLLVVVGSPHAVGQAQSRLAAMNGFEAIEVPASILPARSTSPQWTAIRDRAVGLVARRQDVIVSVPALNRSKRLGPGDALGVAARLGRLIAAIVTRHPVAALLASGGDTLAATTVACGWSRLTVQGEVAPGVACAATGDPRAPVVVSKAGGFGPETAWIDVRARLRAR